MRILVTGFPHSGTGIVRKLIGNHRDVFDYFESDTGVYRPDGGFLRNLFRRGYQGRNHMVFKRPFGDLENRNDADRIIYVVRDPRDVFGSLNRRFGANVPEDHSPQAWQTYAKFFLCRQTGLRHAMIRYEDLFDRDCTTLKRLFAWLGLPWHKEILRTETRYAPTDFMGDRPETEPARTDHQAFRAWQTSQPFFCKTGQSRQYLDAATAGVLAGMPECVKLGYRVEASDPPRKAPVAVAPSGATIRRFPKPLVNASVPLFLRRAGMSRASSLSADEPGSDDVGVRRPAIR